MSVEPNKPIGKIVTLSQLPELLETNIINDISLQDNFLKSFIEVSYKNDDNKFSSNKVSLSNLIVTGIEKYLDKEYNLLENNIDKIDINKIKISVDNIVNNETNLINNKILLSGDFYKTNTDYINKYVTSADIEENFQNNILNYSNILSETKLNNFKQQGKTLNINGQKDNGFTVLSDNNEYNNNYVLIIALIEAEKDLNPNDCYVSLEMNINNEWKIIDIKPWISGKFSEVYQYISFNGYFEKNTKLRVIPKFNITSNVSGNILTYNTLSVFW